MMDKPTHLTQKQIDYCMECGLCTGSCPISRELSKFSPRQLIKQAVELCGMQRTLSGRD
jgi:heterodisulfide reductase subunit C